MGGRRRRDARRQPLQHQRHRRRIFLCERRSDRSGGRGGESRVPRLVAHDAAGAARHPLARFPGNSRPPRGAWPIAGARGRQDAAGSDRRSRARGADIRLLRRRDAAHSGREDGQRAPGGRYRDHARSRRRRRNHRAVEFPDRDSRLEDRAGARLRQHRRLQARRPRAGMRACARRDHRARGSAEGRLQSRHGPRLGGRPGDARPSQRRRDHLHRLGRDRPTRRRGVHEEDAEVPARNGRQESARRPRRRGSQDRRRMRGQRRLFLHGSALHGVLAPDRHRRRLRALRRRARRAHARRSSSTTR